MQTLRPNLAAPTRSVALDLGLLLGRLITAGSLIAFHTWGQSLASYHYFFGSKTPWPLVHGIEAAGLPLSLPAAVLATFASGATAVAFAFGILFRVASLALGLLCAAATLVIGHPPETAMLYGALALVFLLAGPGAYSADALLRSSHQRHAVKATKYR